MPAATPDQLSADRRTGEAAIFRNKAKLAAHQQVMKAKADRTAALADAHASASNQLRRAHEMASNRLSATISKYYMRIRGFGDSPKTRWAEVDSAGNVSRITDTFAEDAFFDDANQRVYFSRPGGDAPGWGLYSSDMSGGDLKLIGARKFLDDRTGGIAVDLAEQAVFWIGGDGVVSRTSLAGGDPLAATRTLRPGGETGAAKLQAPWPACITIDPGRRRIYWGFGGMIGAIDYDGNDLGILYKFGPFDRTNNFGLFGLQVDAALENLYFVADRILYRARTDGSEAIKLPTTPPIWGNYWFDPATQLLMSVVSVLGAPDEMHLYIGSVDRDAPPDQFVVLTPKQDFAIPIAIPDCPAITKLIAITTGSEASGRVAVATIKLSAAHAAGPPQIAQAHQDAQQQRDAAQAKVEAAHTEAAAAIADSQQHAAAVRSQAQDAARARQAEAAQHLSDARAQAAQRKQDASNQAQALIARKQQEADAIKSPAQAQLDEARRRQQNS